MRKPNIIFIFADDMGYGNLGANNPNSKIPPPNLDRLAERGIKIDAWEGGHRVPFVASWPAVIPQGTRCDQLVGLGDFMATCAA